MKELLKYYPRQVAYPERRTCLNEKQFFNSLNSLNNVKPRLYFSLYNCESDGSFLNPLIDKISFDFDNERCFDNVMKMIDYCDNHNYRYCIVFSTKGFWVHVLTKNYKDLNYPKDALRQSHEFIIKEIGYKYNKTTDSDIDFHIIGDIARVSRMIGTRDTRRNLFCISIKKEEMISYDYVKELSKKQRFDIFWNNSDYFDIKPFDNKVFKEHKFMDLPLIKCEINVDDKIVQILPPCVQDMLLKQEKATYRGRFLFTIYMRELGFNKITTDELARKYFSLYKRTDELDNNYEHYQKVHCLDLAYANERQFFPNCETLFGEGFCNGRCKYYNKLYKK